LSDTKKNGTGNESDQKAETTWFKLLVKIVVGTILNNPQDALNRGAVLIRFSIHKEVLRM